MRVGDDNYFPQHEPEERCETRSRSETQFTFDATQHPVTLGLISMTVYEQSDARAAGLIAQGTPISDVVDTRLAKGLDEHSANHIAHDAAVRVADWQSKPSNVAAWGIGLVLIAIGGIVAFGNLTGLFPTLPYLGAGIAGLGGLFVIGGRGG